MRLHECEYRELIIAAKERLAVVTDEKAKGYLAGGIRKLEESAERKRENKCAAFRRGAIRRGGQKA